jgi:hypothetical protein
VENKFTVSAAFIHDDFMGETIVVNRLFKERGGGHFVALFRQHKINGVTKFIDRSVQVNPLAFDFNVGFIHPPRRCNGTFTLFGLGSY